MITQRMLMNVGSTYTPPFPEAVWSLIVESTAEENMTTGIPIAVDVSNVPAKDKEHFSITINWGDGASTLLAIEDFGDATYNTIVVPNEKLTHTYTSEGQFTVTVASNFWPYINFVTYVTASLLPPDITSPIYALHYFKASIIEVGVLPKFFRLYQASANSNSANSYSNFKFFLCFCKRLTTFAEDLFINNPDITTVDSLFYGSSIQGYPSTLFDPLTNLKTATSCFKNSGVVIVLPGLFSKCTKLTNVSSCFANCAYLESIQTGFLSSNPNLTSVRALFDGSVGVTYFNLTFPATGISDAQDFCELNSNSYSRIIRCPAGSTTATTLKALPASMGLTIEEY